MVMIEEKEEVDDEEGKEEMIMVGVFIERPQPFLSIILNSIINSALPLQSTQYYIYNQVSGER
ncbi:hypothetical protein E2C01_084160 [Portunus trituberculatus]|uniref:Uncharacterized protein n=1 Tax=Portunus trituberculatus TaxID=210409 RepID=A0A5B7J9Y7_PORTR|nr:hypothetical protein [Portunus trituberculatus]